MHITFWAVTDYYDCTAINNHLELAAYTCIMVVCGHTVVMYSHRVFMCMFFKRSGYCVFTKWFCLFHSGSVCCLILRSASVFFHSGYVCCSIKGKTPY